MRTLTVNRKLLTYLYVEKYIDRSLFPTDKFLQEINKNKDKIDKKILPLINIIKKLENVSLIKNYNFKFELYKPQK